jgi:DNA-binding LytR/AlgR family response regulator
MTTAVLVDDEPNLTDYLARKLQNAWPELEIIGTAVNGRQALTLCEELVPDIVFLDIQMPGLNGLQVAERLDPEVRVVFVTAYDDYAVKAFETSAVDYLMKPVDDKRLSRTVERLKQAADSAEREALTRVIHQLVTPESGHLRWLRCQQSGATRLVPVDSVVYFQADGKYTSVRTASEEHLIRMSIRELEDQLDPNAFWRVHRSIIVRVDEILEAHRDLRGRYTLSLRSRPESLRTSQKYGHLFKGM